MNRTRWIVATTGCVLMAAAGMGATAVAAPQGPSSPHSGPNKPPAPAANHFRDRACTSADLLVSQRPGPRHTLVISARTKDDCRDESGKAVLLTSDEGRHGHWQVVSVAERHDGVYRFVVREDRHARYRVELLASKKH